MPYLHISSSLPYYAVIFTNQQGDDLTGYTEMAERMEKLAKRQPGYLGMEHARSALGITISYWKSQEAIANWKEVSEHLFAQGKGKSQWYNKYSVRVCLVEREYFWESDNQ